MGALTGTVRGRSIEVIERVPPAQIWSSIAKAPQQFVLVGESRHALNCTRHALAQGIPALAAGGLRHLGLEYHRDDTQSLLDRFQQLAGNGPVATMRRLALLRGLPNQSLVAWEMPGYWASMNRILNRATCHGVRLHAMDDKSYRRRHPEVWQQAREVVEDTERRSAEAARKGEMARPGLPQSVKILLEGRRQLQAVLDEGYYQRRHETDAERAGLLKAAAGKDRAGLFYGHRHFQGGRAPGIGHFLPADNQIYVALGTGAYLLNEFVDTPNPARLPDFVIMADRKAGIVTRQAIERGLWPKA